MSGNAPIRSGDLAVLLLTAAILLFPALGQTPFRRAEIYFADAARAMVERGDWLIPYFRGEPFFDKPALTYWLIGISLRLFGYSSGAARIASAVAALLVVAATVWLGRLLWKDRASALAGGWVLVATASFMTFGRMAMSDMLLTLWSIVAVALLLSCYQAVKPRLCFLALGAVLGLGFLTKGPIALVIPVLGGLYILWSRRKERLRLTPGLFLVSAGIFIVFALGWFALVYRQLGAAPLEHFFLRENFQRFSGEAHDPGRPFWFYLTAYLGEGAPWSFFLAPAAIRLHFQRQDRGITSLLVWIALVAGLLTASRGKVDYYLLPLYPVAALCVGRYFSVSVWGRSDRILARAVLGLVFLLTALLPIALSRLPVEWRPDGWPLAVVFILCGAASLACLSALPRPRPATVLRSLVLAVAVVFVSANFFALPSFYAAQPNRAVLDQVSRERVGKPALRVASHGDPIQVHRDLLFQSRVSVQDSSDLFNLAASSEPYLLLASREEAEVLKSLRQVREIASYEYLTSRVFSIPGLVSPPKPDRIVLLANFGL